MAVHIQIGDITPEISYTPATSTTVFTVPFPFFTNADLVVRVAGVLKTINTDYTVTGAGLNSGGTVTLTVAVSGVVVLIVRDVPVERTTDFPAAGPLQIDSLNTQLDKLIAIDQQIERGLARTIRLPDAEATTDQRIPTVASRASKYAAWDASGTLIGTAGAPPNSVPVSAFMETVLGATSGPAAQNTLGLPNVKGYGAVGDGVTNDTAAFNTALAAMTAAGGGVLYVPPGTYKLTSGITVADNIRLVGSGRNSTILTSGNADVTVVTLSGGRSGLEHLWILGKGTNSDTGTFGASAHALVVSGGEVVVRDILVWGGNSALFVSGNDGIFENVYANNAYGGSLVATIGSNWYKRCKFDHFTVGGGITSTQPYGARANSTAYTVGQVVTTGGYAIQCVTAGTSGVGAPTLKNYGINMTDGTAVWKLLAPAAFVGILVTTGALENRFEMCDWSSDGTTNSVEFSEASGVLQFSQCVFSHGFNLQAGAWTEIRSSALGGSISIAAAYAGTTTVQNNRAFGGITVIAGANVNYFIIKDNFLIGGAITVAAGTSDHYIISGNVGAAVSDGGTGVNKSVTGNVA